MAPGDRDHDVDSFEDWISEIARSRDTSEQEIIDRMLSSYWILDELTGMLEENRGGGSDRRGSAEPAGRESQGGRDDRSIPPELIELLTTLAEGDAGRSRREAPARDRDLDDLRALIDQNERSSAREREFGARVDDLREAIERLDARLGESASGEDRPRRADPERRVRRLSDRVSTLEDSVGELEGRVDEDVDALASSVTELRGTVDRLEERIEAGADDGAVAELSAELSTLEGKLTSLEASLSEQVQTLETRIDDDFESVEEILKYLLKAVDDLDEEAESLRRAYAELRPAVENREEAERLEGITATANREGLESAECGACGNDVTIGLLRRPACPHCGQSFDGLETRSRLWWTNGTLTTGEPGTDPLPTQDEPSTRAPADAAAPSTGSKTGDSPQFDWLE